MITIKDMAEIAGVSPTTVANVLHGRTKKMSKETLKKVQDVIDQIWGHAFWQIMAPELSELS